MKADAAKWVERNLGFNPIAHPPPLEAFALPAAISGKNEDFQREIIDFDSEGAEGREFPAFSTSPRADGFGCWSSVCSAIVCWACVAAL